MDNILPCSILTWNDLQVVTSPETSRWGVIWESAAGLCGERSILCSYHLSFITHRFLILRVKGQEKINKSYKQSYAFPDRFRYKVVKNGRWWESWALLRMLVRDQTFNSSTRKMACVLGGMPCKLMSPAILGGGESKRPAFPSPPLFLVG